MANQWFKFKKFMIRQDRCAMKVGTDSVILGAWARIGEECTGLDIGTGTGLLALMLAQRAPGLHMDALEIEAEAVRQATENARESDFSNRIHVIHGDFKNYFRNTHKRYDLIISNPPYFIHSIAQSDTPRVTARHARMLGLNDIMEGSARLLQPGGRLHLVMPYEQFEEAVSEAVSHELHLIRMLEVHATPESGPKRCCVTFFNPGAHESGLRPPFSIQKQARPGKEILVIEEGGRHRYSDRYRRLTRDFYLGF